MIWYFCLVISFILLAFALKISVGQRFGKLKIGLVLIFLLVTAYTLYIPIFFNLFNATTALVEGIINVMQVISLDADFTANYEMINEEIHIQLVAKIYLAVLGVVHFLLPAISVLAAYTILIRCFANLQIVFMNLRRRPLFIFSEYNEKSANLALNIKKKYNKCDIIFADCDGNSRYQSIREFNKVVYIQDAISYLKITHKKDRDIFYFCISHDEDKNMDDTIFLAKETIKLEKLKQKKIHILMFSAQNESSIMLDSIEKGCLDIRQINAFETAVYRLIDSYPLFHNADENKISVLLFGLTDINKTLFKAISWCGQLSGYSLKINIVGINISNSIDELKLECPSLFSKRYNLAIYDANNYKQLLDLVKEKCLDSTYISVDCFEDGKTIEMSLALRRLFYGIDGKFKNKPLIFSYIRNQSKYNMVKGLTTSEQNEKKRVPYDIIPYGCVEELYTCDNMVDSDIDFFTKGVHLVYEDIYSDDEINVEEALERYNIFEVNKRSSRSNAMHIRYKLRTLGLDYTDNPDAEEVNLETYLTDEKLELLTRAEHDRWMAFLDSEGWIPSTIDQVNAYKESGLSAGKHNCQLMKMHPYICPFDDLQKCSEELGLPDSTVYDRELIRRIPDILHDKWNISPRKYKIIKIDKGDCQ